MEHCCAISSLLVSQLPGSACCPALSQACLLLLEEEMDTGPLIEHLCAQTLNHQDLVCPNGVSWDEVCFAEGGTW